MQDRTPDQVDSTVLRLLKPGETLRAHARAVEANISATDERLIVVANDRVVIDLGYERLRRIQFDLERTRPATLVIVPELPADPPQVLGIPLNEVGGVAAILAVLGERLTGDS
jgi:hypothetical protein